MSKSAKEHRVKVLRSMVTLHQHSEPQLMRMHMAKAMRVPYRATQYLADLRALQSVLADEEYRIQEKRRFVNHLLAAAIYK